MENGKRHKKKGQKKSPFGGLTFNQFALITPRVEEKNNPVGCGSRNTQKTVPQHGRSAPC